MIGEFCFSFFRHYGALKILFFSGFQNDVAKFFIFALTMLLVAIAGASLAFFFSATVQVFAIANLMIALCYVFMMVSQYGLRDANRHFIFNFFSETSSSAV
jgi:hypothetical protein